MLPNNHHPHDKNWLLSQIKILNVDDKIKAIVGYDRVYNEVLLSCDCEIKRHNKARREANLRLLRFCKRRNDGYLA